MSRSMAQKKSKREHENTFDPPSSWKCPKCDNTVTVLVIMNYPPACHSSKHRRDIFEMVRTDK